MLCHGISFVPICLTIIHRMTVSVFTICTGPVLLMPDMSVRTHSYNYIAATDKLYVMRNS
jgi:hypothetical protein